MSIHDLLPPPPTLPVLEYSPAQSVLLITRLTLFRVIILLPMSSGLFTCFACRKKKTIFQKEKSSQNICIKSLVSVNTNINLNIFYTMIANLFSLVLILTVSSTGFWFLTQI